MATIGARSPEAGRPPTTKGLSPKQNPADIAHLRTWVGWREEIRDGRKTKVPYDPVTGSMAASNNSATWATRGEAEFWAANNRGGVGIMFRGRIEGHEIKLSYKIHALLKLLRPARSDANDHLTMDGLITAIEQLAARLGDLCRHNGMAATILKPDLLTRLRGRRRGSTARWWAVVELQGCELDGF